MRAIAVTLIHNVDEFECIAENIPDEVAEKLQPYFLVGANSPMSVPFYLTEIARIIQRHFEVVAMEGQR